MLYYRYKGSKSFVFNKIRKIRGRKREISVILPTYNEEGNIELLVKEIKKELRGINFEVIIVDDNSKDKTAEIIDNLAGKNIIALHRYGKKGLFSAFLDGIFISNGKYIITMDSDFNHPPKIIKEFLKYKEKYDIVSGSRFVEGGRMQANFLRKYGSILVNRVCSFVMGLKIKDVADDFQLMNKEKFNQIRFKYKPVFGEWNFELLYRAVKMGFKIKEIPYVLKARKGGASKMGGSKLIGLIKYALIYFKRAFQLRFEG